MVASLMPDFNDLETKREELWKECFFRSEVGCRVAEFQGP
jgi:hypothetical protein